MTEITAKVIAQQAVIKIILDIKSRSGIGNEFENIDTKVQQEIENDWEGIILNLLEHYTEETTSKLSFSISTVVLIRTNRLPFGITLAIRKHGRIVYIKNGKEP